MIDVIVTAVPSTPSTPTNPPTHMPQDGAFAGAVVESMSMKAVADNVYAVPAMSFKLRLARTHNPPRR